MSELSRAKRKAAVTGVVPEGFVELANGEIIKRERLAHTLSTAKEDTTIVARQNGTAYQKNPDGSHRRIGKQKLTKAEKKWVKRLKVKVRNGVVSDPGRPVVPHRSGGAQVATMLRDVQEKVTGAMGQSFGLDEAAPIAEEIYAKMAKDPMVQAAIKAKAEESTPEPVRCLTQQARDDRDDFEAAYLNSNGCTCFLNAPCSFCTHPGNPANQEEDDSCWTTVIPSVVKEDPERRTLSGLPSPFVGFVLTACVVCEFSDRCTNEEAVLRSYDRCGDERPPAMNVEQREWCLQEINAVEGWNRDDHEAVPDNELARAVLYAWGDYARDKGCI